VPGTIVIGSDGTAQAEGALRFGATLASALSARVVVACAYFHRPPTRGDAGAFERYERLDADAVAQRGAATVQGIVDVQPRVTYGGSIAEALHRVAEAEQADLPVIATSARPRIAGHQPGSVTEQVIHHSPCPVAVIPPQEREPRFSRIGVAVDGTPAARRVLEFALQLIGRVRDGAPKLHLLHVSPAPGAFDHVRQPGSTSVPPDRGLEPHQLQEIAAEAAAYGQVEEVEHLGDADKELVRMSEGLDLLVCGSRDRGAVKRIMLGSVSTHVVRNATCPVIVVPAADRARGAESAPAEPATA
jgi:nucleotide-binding universal stress UspA family protein